MSKIRTSTAAAVKAHPAGTFAGAAGPIAGLLISYLHLSPDQAGAVVAAGGLATAGISWVAGHGGLAGLWRDLVHGTGQTG